MRCIHIASFDGNIGDVLSHEGTYNMFRKYVKKKIKFTEFEIRDIYNKFRHKPTSYNWRIYNYFIRDLWNRGFYTNSPSDVLEDIYENRMYTTGRAEFYSRHWVRELSHHPNCSIKLAIIMSQSEHDHNKNCGFEALVRLEKQNKNL